jgi:hypothetical protein
MGQEVASAAVAPFSHVPLPVQADLFLFMGSTNNLARSRVQLGQPREHNGTVEQWKFALTEESQFVDRTANMNHESCRKEHCDLTAGVSF